MLGIFSIMESYMEISIQATASTIEKVTTFQSMIQIKHKGGSMNGILLKQCLVLLC